MIIAVDTGGTKTLVAAFSRTGEITKRRKFPTPLIEADYIATLATTIRDIADDDQIERIVVAMPGIVKNGVAVWCNNLQWRNFAVQSALEVEFPTLPILIENDANLGGLGAVHTLPQSTELVSALYVTISTGIGTGYIVNEAIDPGLRQSEGGRMLVEYGGAVREWETFASGKAIAHTFKQYASEIEDPATWENIADRISRGFLAIIPLMQPDMIIIGGSIGTYFAEYEVALHTILRAHLPAHILLPEIVAAKDPEEIVIHGCYRYGIQQRAT